MRIHRIYSRFLTKLLCTRIFSQALAVVRSMAVQNGQVQAGFGFLLCLLVIFLFGEKKPLGKLLGNRSATLSSHLHCNGVMLLGSIQRYTLGISDHIPTPLLVKIGYTQSILHHHQPSGRGTFRSSKLSRKKATS